VGSAPRTRVDARALNDQLGLGVKGLSVEAIDVVVAQTPYVRTREHNTATGESLYSADVATWLQEVAYSVQNIATRLKLPVDYAARLLSEEGYSIDDVAAEVLPRFAYGQVWQNSVPYRTAPRNQAVREVCRSVDITTPTFYRWLDEFFADAPLKITVYGGISRISRDDFRRFIAWLPSYAPPGWYTLLSLEVIFGSENKSRIRTYVRRHSIESRQYRTWRNAITVHYPLAALNGIQLRPKVPPAGDWLTVKSIGPKLGRSTNWVARRLNSNLMEVRLADNGAAENHYPPSELARLRQMVETVPPAGDWLTVKGISAEVGRDPDWVIRRLDLALGEARLTATGAPRDHYPPSELARLKALKAGEPPPAGDWLTMNGISVELRRDHRWVTSRLNPALSEVRLSATGAPRDHYPPSELDRLRQMVGTAAAAGDWLTVNGMATKLGRVSAWIERRLDHELAEVRLSATGAPRDHYPPSEFRRLQALAAGEPPPAGEWLSINAIARAVGLSKTWVKPRLDSTTAEDRVGANSKVSPHYPPSELERLRGLSSR
jgi:hypothetical protein